MTVDAGQVQGAAVDEAPVVRGVDDDQRMVRRDGVEIRAGRIALFPHARPVEPPAPDPTSRSGLGGRLAEAFQDLDESRERRSGAIDLHRLEGTVDEVR